jgi:ELWxxDGT repeat protein
VIAGGARARRAAAGADLRRAAGPVVEQLEGRQLLAATLIQDLDLRTASSNPASIVTTPGQAFFLTYDAAGGSPTYYLYHTDATAAGTTALLSSPSPIGYMAAAGGLAYFDAKQSGVSQAWRSDGTAAGTAPLTSFATAGMTNSSFTDVNGTVFFVAANSVTGGVELWKTGGTAGSTAQVVDPSQFASISNLTNLGGTLYFTAAPKATSSDVELWKTDGTAAGTVRVKDVRAGTSGSAPSSLTNVNGTLFFIANGGSTTNGLWKSDGTDAGTAFVSPFGGVGQPASPQALTGLGSTLYFTAALGNQRYLFKSDGTSSGTGVVAYITPLVSNGTGFNSAPQGLTPFGGQLYFTAVTPDAGREIWRTDGTGAGTVRVTDVWPGPSSTTPSGLTVFNGAIYFAADDGASGLELWRTDGTAAGTARVSDGYPGPLSSAPFGLRAMPGTNGGPGRLVFAAMDALHGTELWASDGTAAGTGMVTDVNTAPVGSDPTMLTAVGNRVFFNAAGLLWVSDGVGGHTQSLTGSTIDATGVATSVVDMRNGLPTTLVIGDVLYYVSGGRLWRSDGTRAGTYQVSGAASKLSSLARVGNLIYFSADDGVSGEELWRSDGTAAGTYRLVDIYAGKVSSAPRQITDVNGIAYFKVGSRVYRSDGTPAGTFAITGDIPNPDSLTGFQRVGNALYFNTFGALWKSDGTAAGTVNVIAGLGLTIAQTSTPRPLGSGVYFLAYTRNSDGWIPGLYKTDGTLAGTALVKVIDTLHTADGQAGYDLTVVGNRLFFTGPDAATLWTSDGTAAGTVIVKAFGAGAPVTALTAVGNTLYFTSAGTLFSSDGTPGGTVAVSNVPAPALTGAGRLVAFDGALAFAATHPLYGAEPWIVDAPTTVPAAPGSLAATAVSGGEIDLAWVDRSTGESGFRIERSTDPTFATIDSSVLLPPGRTRHSDRLLAAGTTYYYRVVAYSRAGDSTGVTASATTPAGAPTAPTALVAKADGERAVVLTWTGTAANATGYVVQRSTDPRFDSIEATFTLPADAVGYTDTTVTALNRYYYRVYAMGAGGASEFASAFAATPDRSPAGLQAVGVSPTRIDLRWSNPATTAGTFRIERRRPGESTWATVWTTAGLEYPDVNPTAGPASVWEYRVVALTAAGDSPSLPVTVSTTAPVLTTPVKSLPPVVEGHASSVPSRVVVSNGVGYFVANGRNGKELWRTDGTPAGTLLVTRRVDYVQGLVDVNGTLFFVAGEFGVNSGIYKTDGTDAGTVLVKDINPGGNASLHDLVAFTGKLSFRGVGAGSDSDSLWSSDGTAAGTVLVKSFSWANGGNNYRRMVVSGGRLWLGANAPEDGSPTVYVSDGTAAGTTRVVPAGAGNAPFAADAFYPGGERRLLHGSAGVEPLAGVVAHRRHRGGDVHDPQSPPPGVAPGPGGRRHALRARVPRRHRPGALQDRPGRHGDVAGQGPRARDRRLLAARAHAVPQRPGVLHDRRRVRQPLPHRRHRGQHHVRPPTPRPVRHHRGRDPRFRRRALLPGARATG